MKIIRSIKSMYQLSGKLRRKNKTIGFVPTMGVLHAGHLSLIRRARRENDLVIVSIFVNPAQFGPKEDFKKYPRSFARDAQFCRQEGVGVVFYPQAKDIYPPGYKTYVKVEDLSEALCGKYRLRHFQGVATIVAKLFNIVQPDTVYFGQKDAQQAVIIKKMTQDLNIPVKIKVMPTVRQKNGLAMSSRNVYLNENEKEDALVLSRALNLAGDLIRQGRSDSAEIISRMRQLLNKKKTACIQYISIVDLENLNPVERIKGKILIALAVYIGKIRLIDNIIINA